MTDLRKAAEMALERLESHEYWMDEEAIQALRQALATPEQEPVAWIYRGNFHPFDPSDWAEGETATPLYTAPLKREWQGLTDSEVREAYCSVSGTEWAIGGMNDAGFFAELIEAKLKEKNA